MGYLIHNIAALLQTYPSINGTSSRIRRTTSKVSSRWDEKLPGASDELRKAIHISNTTKPIIASTMPAHGRTCISYTAVNKNNISKLKFGFEVIGILYYVNTFFLFIFMNQK